MTAQPLSRRHLLGAGAAALALGTGLWQAELAFAAPPLSGNRFTSGVASSDFRVLPHVTRPGAPISPRASVVVEDGSPGVQV
ncbi:hypothetical protein [Streptomyces yanii]|uniref:Copper oxidase n=1 Tax=Streptomyces yanii TaxID=78510 RepID=A0ABV5R2U1_9ACTN